MPLDALDAFIPEIPSMLDYEMDSKGGYLLIKMILYRYYCQYKMKHYGMVNSPIIYSHYIYRYQRRPSCCNFHVPLDRI